MENTQILSLDKFLAHAHEIVDQLNSTKGRFILTRDEGAVAVIKDVKEHQKLLDGILMLKLILPGEKDIQTGKTRKQQKVFNH